MSNGFDVYHKWLSIPPQDQPPNHYRLLGLGLFESDPDVIAAAADRQMAHVQTYKTGPHSALSQKLLNEISAAKLCLLRPQKRSPYDEQLRQQLGISAAGTGSSGTAVAAPPMGSPSSGTQPPATSAIGTPSIAAARMSNPAAYADVGPGGDDASSVRPGKMAGAVAAGVSRGMSYPGLSNSPVGPPPPAPPPVTGAPRQPLLGTMTILVSAGAVAVLLLVGIVIVLSRHKDHAPPSTAATPETNPAPVSPGSTSTPAPSTTSVPSTQPITADNPATKNPATQVTSVPGQASSPQAPPAPVNNPPVAPAIAKNSDSSSKTATAAPAKPADASATTIGEKKPPASPPVGEVATTIPSGSHPPDNGHTDKTTTDKPPVDKSTAVKTVPVKVSPVKPAADPALAGKAAVPSAAAIAAAEQRLGDPVDQSASALLEKAHNAAEATEIYVLLRRAIDSAVKQGDSATALSAVNELAHRFAVNSLAVRLQTLNDLQAHLRTSASLSALAEAASALIDEATEAGQTDSIEKLEEISLTAARKSGDIEAIRKVTLRILHLRNPPAPASDP